MDSALFVWGEPWTKQNSAVVGIYDRSVSSSWSMQHWMHGYSWRFCPQCTKDTAGKWLKNQACFHILFVDIPFAHVSNAAIGQDAPLELEELARFSVPDALKTLACDIISHDCCNLFFEKRFGLCHLLGPRLARRGCAGLDRGQNGQVWFWFAPMLLYV